jgi:hypothetical protein
MESKPKFEFAAIDWRLRFGMLVTAAWLLLGVVYISSVVGWEEFTHQNAPALGSFLEGAFAPLAFMWLVVGFFLQQQQLQENSATIRLQLNQMIHTAEQAEVQARAIQADELHSRQDTFLRVVQVVNEQLGMIAGWIITSYVAGEDPGIFETWQRLGRGETAAFSMDAMRRVLGEDVEASVLFHGTEIRAAHSARFVEAFERLIESGANSDPRGMIVGALRDGAHGRIYRMIRDSAPSAD